MNATKHDPWKRAEKLVAKHLSDNVSPEVQKLISLANFDLYYGPVGDGSYGDPARDEFGNENEWAGYPGFSKACDAILAGLRNLPTTLYVDLDCDCVTEDEPEDEKCEDCDGQGETTSTDLDAEGETSQFRSRCGACGGRGCFEPCGDWYKFEAHEILKSLVGRELAEYI